MMGLQRESDQRSREESAGRYSAIRGIGNGAVGVVAGLTIGAAAMAALVGAAPNAHADSSVGSDTVASLSSIDAVVAPVPSALSGPDVLDEAAGALQQGNTILSNSLAADPGSGLELQYIFQTGYAENVLSASQSIQNLLPAAVQDNQYLIFADNQLLSANEALVSLDQTLAQDPGILAGGVGEGNFQLYETLTSTDFHELAAGFLVLEADFFAVVDPELLFFVSFDPITSGFPF